MSHPTDVELTLLGRIADELREVFAERGYRIDVAMDADPAFGSGLARSAVTRDLALDAVSVAAGRVGVDFRPVNGHGREFRFFIDGIDRRYRFRRAHRMKDGNLIIRVSSESSLSSSLEDDTLFPSEQYVFGWTPSADGLIDETVVSPVRGYVPGKPGHLLLGPEISVGGAGSLGRGGKFTPAYEDLDGFSDDTFALGDEESS